MTEHEHDEDESMRETDTDLEYDDAQYDDAEDAYDEDEPDESEMTDEEYLAYRQGKANRACRGGLAAVLCLEAFVVLLVPRAVAGSTHVTWLDTSLLLALAVLMVVAGFMLTRRWGIAFGSFMQVLMAVTIALVPAIAVVVAIFWAIWGWLLSIRVQTAGTPGGWRMLIS